MLEDVRHLCDRPCSWKTSLKVALVQEIFRQHQSTGLLPYMIELDYHMYSGLLNSLTPQDRLELMPVPDQFWGVPITIIPELPEPRVITMRTRDVVRLT